MGLLDSKVAIVTGGALGIGSACSLEFAREGARVVVADLAREAGEQTVDEIKRLGGQGIMVEADVATGSQCQKVVSEAVRCFGRVDILHNNVGIQPPSSYTNVEDTSEGMWDRIIDVNLKSHFLMSKYCIPEMRKRGGGVIISTSSVQGLQSAPLVPPYAASKGGILSLVRQMAVDYASENIRVLAVNPGAIDTPMLHASAALQGENTQRIVNEWGKGHPLGRLGKGEDIATVVAFLASDKASFMTGEHVNVDGGYMALGSWATAGPSSE